MIEEENNNSGEMIPFKPVNILVTEADTKGYEISKMSDFMGLYAQQMTRALVSDSQTEVLQNLPFADIGIINDLIREASVLVGENATWVLDFDNLPAGIKEKLRKGIYSLGESRQVDGNVRAVIVNEAKERVRDVTVKKVINSPDTLETTRSISNQMQMKQIQDTLVAIQEMQSYQIDRDRDTAILTPFFDARDYILQAQNAKSLEERNHSLELANGRLMTAINGVYTDIKTSTSHLAKSTTHSLFHKQSSIDTFMSNLSDDLQLATRLSGVQMQIYEYLGKRQDAQNVLDRYESVMLDFVTTEIPGKHMSAVDMLHDNFHYSKENQDCWYRFSKDITPTLEKTHKLLEGQQVYIVSVEDNQNEE